MTVSGKTWHEFYEILVSCIFDKLYPKAYGTPNATKTFASNIIHYVISIRDFEIDHPIGNVIDSEIDFEID